MKQCIALENIKRFFLVVLSVSLVVIVYYLVNLNIKRGKIMIITTRDNSTKVNLTNCGLNLGVKSNYQNEIDKNTEYSFKDIENKLEKLSIKLDNGGCHFTESNRGCKSNRKIAIIVPYRDRIKNLKFFLSNMHPFLSKQNATYGIYFIEPKENLIFNRGLLMNIGFLEAIKDIKRYFSDQININITDNYWNCFVFHDVDMIPEDERLVYKCDDDLPVHYAVAVKKFGYSHTGYFAQYFGGIVAFTYDQYVNINGLSNLYFGWGGEDDDLHSRVKTVYRSSRKRPHEVARIYTDEHEQDSKVNPERFRLLDTFNSRVQGNKIIEGLTTIKYSLLEIEKNRLYTRLLVDYDKNLVSKGFRF